MNEGENTQAAGALAEIMKQLKARSDEREEQASAKIADGLKRINDCAKELIAVVRQAGAHSTEATLAQAQIHGAVALAKAGLVRVQEEAVARQKQGDERALLLEVLTAAKKGKDDVDAETK